MNGFLPACEAGDLVSVPANTTLFLIDPQPYQLAVQDAIVVGEAEPTAIHRDASQALRNS